MKIALFPSLFVLLQAALLQGCFSPSESTQFQSYLDRVSRVLEIPSVDIGDGSEIVLPSKRELTIEPETITLGLLESYELRKCGLFNLIAERNSILGKVQDPFRELDFQVALLNGLNRCKTSHEISEMLSKKLTEIESIKYQQLPIYVSNTIFSSDAFRSQLGTQTWISPNITSLDSELTASLATLQSVLSGQMESITPYQEVIEKKVVLGPLLFSMRSASESLATVTAALKFADGKVVCEKGRDKTQFNYLKNIFQSQYVEKIQPYLANLDGLYLQVAPYTQLFHLANDKYTYPLANVHGEFRASIKEHVEYWQALFKRCGHSPSR
ncbi:DUF3080 domain-containing protein [Vibrio sonorensis]|uniref:DUF3080 domain-containing protein n=1 Tax=Vibrio sonorensis TaxID=1004316 RepID=UPI0008DA79BE|nr:DUF3080 domain-containing protein [Vibrio sonorensis]